MSIRRLVADRLFNDTASATGMIRHPMTRGGTDRVLLQEGVRLLYGAVSIQTLRRQWYDKWINWEGCGRKQA
jgi:hypothetical protein